MFVQLQNTFASAINKSNSLPKYILVVLNDDLITFLKYDKEGAAGMLGNWLMWLSEQLSELIKTRKEKLPVKAKKDHEPCIYWAMAPTHQNFNARCNIIRKKYNSCLETLFKGNTLIRILKLRDHWNPSDSSMVINDTITKHGLNEYWESVEASFMFNSRKHELFLAKRLLASQPKADTGKESCVEDGRQSTSRTSHLDEIQRFFKRHGDTFHWHNSAAYQRKPQSGNRFFMPKPRQFKY